MGWLTWPHDAACSGVGRWKTAHTGPQCSLLCGGTTEGQLSLPHNTACSGGCCYTTEKHAASPCSPWCHEAEAFPKARVCPHFRTPRPPPQACGTPRAALTLPTPRPALTEASIASQLSGSAGCMLRGQDNNTPPQPDGAESPLGSWPHALSLIGRVGGGMEAGRG